jgi:hypothetical protein
MENRTVLFLGAIFWAMVIIVGATVLAVMLLPGRNKTEVEIMPDRPEGSDRYQDMWEKLWPSFKGEFPSTESQSKALDWLVDHDPMQLTVEEDDQMVLQRFVLYIVYANMDNLGEISDEVTRVSTCVFPASYLVFRISSG